MAELNWEQSYSIPGHWTLRSNHPAALAAVPDALVQYGGLAADRLSCWALHPNEQTGGRFDAYLEERQELGPGAVVDVAETLRPRQQNVVWVDRHHLLATAAPAQAASRLLGLYVASKGSLVVYVHDPATSAPLATFLNSIPISGGNNWSDAHLVSNCRFVVQYKGPTLQLQLVASPTFALTAGQALNQLRDVVAPW